MAARQTARRPTMTTQHEAWLSLTKEEAIEPELPICDPHHHLWDYPDKLTEGDVPVFAREPRHYLLNDLLDDIDGGHNILKTVFLECNAMYRRGGPAELRWVGETEFVNGIAAQANSGLYGKTEVAAGIVGFADLTLGEGVARTLEAHIAAAPNRFRGIRHISTWDEANNLTSRSRIPNLLADSTFRRGFSKLQTYGLSFDAWLYYTQIHELTDLAKAYPYTQIVLNHIGGPLAIGTYAGKRDEVFHDWRHAIATLGTCPNVAIKLGGMGMPIMGFGWNERPTPPNSQEMAEGMAPYLTWAIEKFGPGRCMFESNFPVDKRSYSYTVLWNAFKRFSKSFSRDDRASLFHSTATKVYRL
jgi:L-fuconolactonase